jgi:hypothetical protein
MTPAVAREPFGTIADRVGARDRSFFDEHPAESAYLRPYVPGEFSPEGLAAVGVPAPEQDSWVLVTALGPGLRTRRPVGRIVAGRPEGGRITLVSPEGMIAEDVPVVGWEGER